MSKTILLAVDAQHYAPQAVDLARELSQDTGDKRRPTSMTSGSLSWERADAQIFRTFRSAASPTGCSTGPGGRC